MHAARLVMETCLDEDRDSREFSRIPVAIPVRVEILPAWKGAVFAAVPGALLNMGCGGARLRVGWGFAPGSRLFVSLPVGMPNLRLLAEVVWASRATGRGAESALYGVQWVEPLSSGVLQSVLLRQGLSSGAEATHELRV